MRARRGYAVLDAAGEREDEHAGRVQQGQEHLALLPQRRTGSGRSDAADGAARGRRARRGATAPPAARGASAGGGVGLQGAPEQHGGGVAQQQQRTGAARPSGAGLASPREVGPSRNFACMHARAQSADPAYASAGIIPYSSQGFWLARMSKGWSDFGGKKEPGDGNDPWTTARRECKEESGLDAPNFECAVTEPAGMRRHFVYCSRVEAAPSPPSRERRQIAAVRLVTWDEYMCAGRPAG